MKTKCCKNTMIGNGNHIVYTPDNQCIHWKTNNINFTHGIG